MEDIFILCSIHFYLFVQVLVMGVAEDCCPKVTAKIHIDQFIG